MHSQQSELGMPGQGGPSASYGMQSQTTLPPLTTPPNHCHTVEPSYVMKETCKACRTRGGGGGGGGGVGQGLFAESAMIMCTGFNCIPCMQK